MLAEIGSSASAALQAIAVPENDQDSKNVGCESCEIRALASGLSGKPFDLSLHGDVKLGRRRLEG